MRDKIPHSEDSQPPKMSDPAHRPALRASISTSNVQIVSGPSGVVRVRRELPLLRKCGCPYKVASVILRPKFAMAWGGVR